jgi:homoserine acetyltransferase
MDVLERNDVQVRGAGPPMVSGHGFGGEESMRRLRSPCFAETPTLVLQCSEDLIAPRPVGEYLQKTLPDCKLHFIDNVGHCPHLGAPSAGADAIEQFLRSH